MGSIYDNGESFIALLGVAQRSRLIQKRRDLKNYVYVRVCVRMRILRVHVKQNKYCYIYCVHMTLKYNIYSGIII